MRANFASVTTLFVVDLAIKRVLNQLNAIINRVVSSFTDAISDAGRQREAGVVQGVVGIVQLALNITIRYVDKAILANVYRSNHENNWKPAKDGVVLYAMTWKPIPVSALVVSTVFYGPFIVAVYFHPEILDVLGGQEAVIARIETFLLGLSEIGFLALVVAVLGLLTVVHYGLVRPGLTALVVTIYLNEMADEQPDEEWQRRIREHSPEFRAFERPVTGEDEVEGETGTWRDLFLP